MTSSLKHIKPGQPRWNSSKFGFKPYDSHCEPSLVSVLFLACGKHEVTRKCLESTRVALQNYSGELEFIFMENGNCEDNRRLFRDFPTQRKKVVVSDNWGITSAANDLYSLSRGEFCLYLENDFLNVQQDVDFLNWSIEVLNCDNTIGSVYLRDAYDPAENWGFAKSLYLPYTCSNEQNLSEGVNVDQLKTESGKTFFVSDHPNFWNFNPQLVRKEMWRRCGLFFEPMPGTCPKHDETHWQRKTAEYGYRGSYLGIGIYHHMGGSRIHELQKLF